MERLPDWRAVEPAEPDAATRPERDDRSAATAIDWRLIALAAACVAAVAGGALAMVLATPATSLTPAVLGGLPTESVAPSPSAAAASEAQLLVDVGGAVERPGLYRLPEGSRIGDAIAAAGGYSPAVDLELAGQRLNLAERLSDGAKVHVPRRGEAASGPVAQATPATGGDGAGTAPGLIDLNSADQALLETLPGVGPVTAAKIVAARQEAPFGSIDDLLARKVVGAATLEKIRPLVTVAP